MTHKRLNYLLLSIICFLACLLIVSTARAEWHAAGYVTGNFAGGAGYSPGIGVAGNASYRYEFLEAKLYGTYAWQHKKKASAGYTWSATGQLRGYVWRDLYLVGAYTAAGYESRFYFGAVWAKHGYNYGGGVGWNPEFCDLQLLVYNKEQISPNAVWYCAFNAEVQLWKWLWGMGQAKYMTYDQKVSGITERWDSLNVVVGLGVRW